MEIEVLFKPLVAIQRTKVFGKLCWLHFCALEVAACSSNHFWLYVNPESTIMQIKNSIDVTKFNFRDVFVVVMPVCLILVLSG